MRIPIKKTTKSPSISAVILLGITCAIFPPSLRSSDLYDDIPIEPCKTLQLAFKNPFLIAMRSKTFRPVLDVRGRPDTITMHTFRAHLRFVLAPVLMVGSRVVW